MAYTPKTKQRPEGAPPPPPTERTSFRYRLYPTKRQQRCLLVLLAILRRLYNHCLSERKDTYDWWTAEGQGLGVPLRRVTYYTQAEALTAYRQHYPDSWWCRGTDPATGAAVPVNHTAQQHVLKRLDRAFSAFFRRVAAGRTPGYPRFRGARGFDSLVFTHGDGAALLDRQGRSSKATSDKTKALWGYVRVQGVGVVPFRLHRPVRGVVKTVTVKKDNDAWFVSFACEVPAEEPAVHRFPDREEGMDLGVNYAVVLSDGTVVPNPRPYQQAQERLAALQRRWDRIKHRPTDDPEKRALRRAIARQHRRIGDRRDNFEQQTSRQLADAYCILHAEDLNIPGLAQGDLSKQVHDVAWGRLLALTDRKAAKAGGRLHRWDPRGSSQACLCGARVPKGRGDRVHRCPACGLELDRDWVSALVMRERGRAALARATSS